MKILTAIFAGVLCGSAFAAQKPIDASSTKEFNVLGVNLTKDKLADLRKKIGPAKIAKPNDTHEFSSICYYGQDGTKITFGSNYSYSDVEVAEYALESTAEKPAKNNCASNSKVGKGLQIPVGLSLGQRRAVVQEILGAPNEITPTKWSYQFKKIDNPIIFRLIILK